MEILFERSLSKKPKVSLILLDWSCRESFHMLHYLNQQNIPRNTYEIIWIEYYHRRSPEIREQLEDCARQSKPPMLDQWIVMDMPDTLYYHKHLMYNIGIVLSKGEIVTICDSDAMARPTFIETIIKSFEEDPNIALHMDEVRNNDQSFHPFNYPSFEEVEGEGAINFKNGTTTGLLDTEDPLHTLNYGACLSARREDLIAIGGADEHLDYLGHVCGPYELTFRLNNFGRKELWHPSELLYHVWHPGQAGSGNYVGPHDGLHMSSTALGALKSGRTQPLLENKSIQALRKDPTLNPKTLIPQLIDPSCFEKWTYEAMSKSSSFYVWETAELVESIFHYNIVSHMGRFYGLPQALGPIDLNKKEEREHPDILTADSCEEIRNSIEQNFIRQRENQSSAEPQTRSSLKSQVFNHIRRLNDILKPDFLSNEPPTLLDSHRGYNLVEYGEKLYSVPFTLGKIDLDTLDANSLPKEIIVAPSQDIAKSLIDQLKNIPEGRVIEEYDCFNIIRWGELLYGAPQFLGPVDRETIESEEGSLFLKSSTLSHLKKLIDQFNHSPNLNVNLENITDENLNQPSVLSELSLKALEALIGSNTETTISPKFLEEWKEYNIIKFKNRFWGIPQKLGEVDLMQETNLSHPSILSASILEGLKHLINEAAEMSAPPKLKGERNNYNIIKYRNQFWGIPHILGEVDVNEEQNLEDPSIISADSLDDLNHQIDEVAGLSTAPQVLESWNNHNIIKYKNRYWGVPHTLGAVDLTQEETQNNSSITYSESLEETKDLIDEKVGLISVPELIAEWANHNILKYKNRFWGIPHTLGKLDITKIKTQKNPHIICADALDKAKSQIDELVGLKAAPELMEVWNNFNIIKYKNQFWCVPHTLGKVDITKQNTLENPSILSTDSFDEAKNLIDEHIGLTAAPELIETWDNFNIMKYKNHFWGVPHSLGKVDLLNQEVLEEPSILHADSIDMVKLKINDTVEMQVAPEFLEEFHKHNILKYNKRFWGIPIELGQIDLTRKEHLSHPSIMSTDTLESIKDKIEMIAGWSSPPEFMGELNGYNLIKYRNRFYGIPHKLGEVSLTEK